MNELIFIFVLASAIWIGMRYVVIPIILKSKFKLSASPKIEILEWKSPALAEAIPMGTIEYHSSQPSAQELDQAQSDFFLKNIEAFEQLGFSETIVFKVVDATSNTSMLNAIAIHRTAGETVSVSASKTVIQKATTEQIITQSMQIAFSTEFESGEDICTSNTREPQLFRRAEGTQMNLLPSVADIHELLQIHRWIVTSSHLSEPRKIPDYGDSFEKWYLDIYRKLMERQVDARRFRFDNGTFKLTNYGAFFMGWNMTFPLKQQRERAIQRRERELLREYRVACR